MACVSDEADESYPYRPPEPTCNERDHQSRIAALIVWVFEPVLADPLAIFTTTMLLIDGDADCWLMPNYA